MMFPEFVPPKEFLEKRVTHIAWSPYFDQDGNFVRSIQVGEGCLETDGTAQILQYAKVTGYDSGYLCIIPSGQQPPPPPPEILEAARIEVQERREADSISLAQSPDTDAGHA